MNIHIVSGNLGGDPIINSTANGTTVANFSVATSRYAGRDDNGESIYETDWINCVAFGHSADYIAKSGRKGSFIEVQGDVRQNSYENDDGQTVYQTKTYVNQVKVINRDGGGNSSNSESGGKTAKNTKKTTGRKSSSKTKAPFS